jgi:flagellar hook-associated protein 1 FlgK
MSGLFGVLNMARWSAIAQQTSIEVISHNVANANTPGFSRQKVYLETGQSVSSPIGQLGTGVRATEIYREYDSFVESQLNYEKQLLGNWQAQEYSFQRIEEIFGESSEYGLSSAMSKFWNAWQALADNPSGLAERVGLLNAAESVANDFNKKNQDLYTNMTNANSTIKGTVDEINALVDQAAELNEKIVFIETSGDNANDFRDQRGVVLNKLGEKVGMNYFEDDRGQVTVFLENGRPLVQGLLGWHLAGDVNINNNNFYNVSWDDGNGNLTDVTGSITRGELSGLLDMRDNTIPAYLEKIDRLAAGIINEVNKLHYYGYGTDGSTENNFFNPLSVVTGLSDDNTGGATINTGTIYDNTVLTLDDYEIRFTAADRYTLYNVTDSTAVTAGYVINASNNTIYLDEDGATERTATLATGNYSATEMAAEIQSALNNAPGAVSAYTVTYDTTAEEFTITSDGTGGTGLLNIRWATGNGGAGSLAAETLGFTVADDSGLSLTSDFAANHAYISGHDISFEGITIAVTDGATGPATGDIFTIDSSLKSAKNMTVNAAIISDVNKIAASADSGGDGNLNALAMAALREGKYMENNASSFDGYYNGVIGTVGVEASNASQTLSYRQTMVDHLNTRRESISGVSIDEEMTYLIQHQQAFSAAARMINVINELLDELLSLV